MAKDVYAELPLVYSCSGCSGIAQLANQVAIELDRDRLAEMSCIAGVGGGVKPILKKARSGRKIIALDGCSLQCVKHCLSLHGIEPAFHYTLTSFGISKTYHMDFSPLDVVDIKGRVANDIQPAQDGALPRGGFVRAERPGDVVVAEFATVDAVDRGNPPAGGKPAANP